MAVRQGKRSGRKGLVLVESLLSSSLLVDDKSRGDRLGQVGKGRKRVHIVQHVNGTGPTGYRRMDSCKQEGQRSKEKKTNVLHGIFRMEEKETKE